MRPTDERPLRARIRAALALCVPRGVLALGPSQELQIEALRVLQARRNLVFGKCLQVEVSPKAVRLGLRLNKRLVVDRAEVLPVTWRAGGEAELLDFLELRAAGLALPVCVQKLRERVVAPSARTSWVVSTLAAFIAMASRPGEAVTLTVVEVGAPERSLGTCPIRPYKRVALCGTSYPLERVRRHHKSATLLHTLLPSPGLPLTTSLGRHLRSDQVSRRTLGLRQHSNPSTCPPDPRSCLRRRALSQTRAS